MEDRYDKFIEKAQEKLDKKYCKFEKNYIEAKRYKYSKKSFDSLNTAMSTSRDILAIKRFLQTCGIDLSVEEEEMGNKFHELLLMGKLYSETEYINKDAV